MHDTEKIRETMNQIIMTAEPAERAILMYFRNEVCWRLVNQNSKELDEMAKEKQNERVS